LLWTRHLERSAAVRQLVMIGTVDMVRGVGISIRLADPRGDATVVLPKPNQLSERTIIVCADDSFHISITRTWGLTVALIRRAATSR